MSSEITSPSPISDVINPLRTAVSHTLVDRTHRELSHREAMLRREKEELLRKISKLEKDSALAGKQYMDLKSDCMNRDYGELLLQKSELETELAESRHECVDLRAESRAAAVESARLREGNAAMSEQVLVKDGKIRVLEERCGSLVKEVEVLEAQNAGLSVKNGALTKELEELKASKDMVSEKVGGLLAENRELKGKCELAAAAMAAVRAELKEAGRRGLKLAGDVARREKQVKDLQAKKKKLEMDYAAVRTAATDRFRGFEKRVQALEATVSILKSAFDAG